MDSEEKEVWRWGVDDVWQSYSSMYQEATSASRSQNHIERYHHFSAALLFGGCAVEAFLNAKMRSYYKCELIDEEAIVKRLRYTALREKLERWPAEFGSDPIAEKDINCIGDFLDLRNEVTHRKRKDHSLYKELDDANIFIFIDALQRAMVTVYSGLRESFPYWLLGWNYIGMNGDETYPCLLNNQQFKHSLNRFGFRVPAYDADAADAWERANMTSLAGLAALKEHVYPRCADIEPRSERFPLMPRLCKRWWDRNVVQQN